MSGLTLTLAEGVAEIALDDGKVNALSEQMIEALLDSLRQAAEADCAVLIYGRPGCFSGGYDRKLIDAGGPACDAMRDAGDRLTLALLDYPAPVVVASTGHAMAKAAFMLLLADYRVGANGAFRIGLNEVAIGMTMPEVAVRLARERIATRWLSRCALQAESMSPAQAMEAGFLDEVVGADEVLTVARAKTAALAKLNRTAYRETRRLLNKPMRDEIAALLGA